ncbi:Peroxiredoxin [Rubritalea squalenifaciens DSM 18772]|uniref:Peroxiredoxin n=1 Tax=Rubritalea squalenifaciens DSM 18772 TaxID=1123071 RepID=A0A1M6N9G8_9BACT|nr:redoxin domain-containing protein [Rubritalea squalenifaciens]SHJ92321.1 Peroxiredoxin [Rubritalea squalenifaciens DSM 18772]
MFKIIATSLLALTLGLSAQQKAPKITPLAIGAKGPDFSLPGTDGKTYSLNSFRDAKYLVLIFTCNHCPDARASRDRINQFAKDYAEKGVQVVAISGNDPQALMKLELGYSVYGDSFDEMKLVAKEHGYVFPYLYDGDKQEASTAYGALATPHTFILGPERTLLYHGQFDNGRRDPGPASKNTVKDTIDALLAGKEVPQATTRIYGCSTKWSWKRDWAAKKREEWKALPVSVDPLDAKLAKTIAKNDTGKIRLINVWSTTCGPCIAEFPELIDTYERFQMRPFDIVTISIDPAKDAEKVKKFIAKQHLPLAPRTVESVKKEGRETNNFHYQSDDLDALADALDTEWQGPIPHTLLVAPGGKILYRHTGQIDVIELRRQIVKALESPEE